MNFPSVEGSVSSGDVALLSHSLILLHQSFLLREHSSIEAFRELVTQEVHAFEKSCRFAQAGPLNARCASYLLCVLFDETVMTSGWNDAADYWQQKTLLSEFFNETVGGETFFKIKEFCLSNLPDLLDVLKIIYLCLCLGFEGWHGIGKTAGQSLEKQKEECLVCLSQASDELVVSEVLPFAALIDRSCRVNSWFGIYKSIGISCLSFLMLTYVVLSALLHLEANHVLELGFNYLR